MGTKPMKGGNLSSGVMSCIFPFLDLYPNTPKIRY